jgi:hypothetical protein
MIFVLRAHQGGAFLASIVEWWRNWRTCRNSLADLHQSRALLEPLARDLNLSPGDLRAVAAQWPHGSDLLSRRLTTLHLNPDQFSPAEVGALRDAQRVCTLCGSKNPCKHDLAKYPTSSDWRTYCPNVDTLSALQSARWFAPLRPSSHGDS